MRQHFEGIGLVARLVAMARAERIHRLAHLGQQPALAHHAEDQLAVLDQVVHQAVEDRVAADHAAVADVRGVAVAGGRAVEDERHVLLQFAIAGIERRIEAAEMLETDEAAERGTVAEPGERLVEAVIGALVEQVFLHVRGDLALGHAGSHPGLGLLGAAVSEALRFAELPKVFLGGGPASAHRDIPVEYDIEQCHI